MSQATTRTPVRPFVGRAKELENLRDALAEAAAGRGSLVLVTGEPGIGKTRLMKALAKPASVADWRVLMARCWEEGSAPAYWPWIQIVRELGGDFERLTGRARDAAARAPVDPESARFALFDAIGRFLNEAASKQRLLLVVDDLHAAALRRSCCFGSWARPSRSSGSSSSVPTAKANGAYMSRRSCSPSWFGSRGGSRSGLEPRRG